MVKKLTWLFKIAASIWPGFGLTVLPQRVRFVVRALAFYDSVRPFADAPPQTPLARLVKQRPEALGALVWPYQCSRWNTETRLTRIVSHYSAIKRLSGPLDFDVDSKLLLLTLDDIREGLHVVIDRPKWFMREGELAINLFLEETRIFTLAFSFFEQGGEMAAWVGAIQGRNLENALDEYRELTKAANGMRARDLLIELFRMFCCAVGVVRILAVSNDYRHHRHPYFGSVQERSVNNYDDIWTERGGIRTDPMCFELSVKPLRRELESMPAKKRGLYRRRYEMLDRFQTRMQANYDGLKAQTTA